jgi:hypothetical protein
MSKPEITLATLYGILQDHNRRFDSIDLLQRTAASAIVSMESKLTEHSAILGALRDRVHSLHGLAEQLLGRLDRLDEEYVMITAALRRLETRFDAFDAESLRQRITALESRVAALEASKS